MKQFIVKLQARLPRLAFWRKAAPQPLDPEQTVVVERPSPEQLQAAVSDELAAPKLSWLARLKEKLRRQPKLEALEETEEPSAAKQSAPPEADAEAEADAPKPKLHKRLLALLSKKWVWIPSAGIAVLALIGGVALLLLNAAQEKEKLQAELQKAQKKIEQQAAVVKQAAAAKQAAAVEISPEQAARAAKTQAPTMIGAATSENKPGVNAGDCLVTSKESVAASLKGCIDSFNAGARSGNKKP